MFPEATPTLNVSESEAKTAEDIPAASADDKEEPRVEEDRVATSPVHQDAAPEENVSNPSATQVEVEANVTTNNNTADDTNVVMPEDNNEAPEANVALEANVAPDVIIPPEAIVPLAAHVNENANAPVPPPRPHIVELAFDHGQPVMV